MQHLGIADLNRLALQAAVKRERLKARVFEHAANFRSGIKELTTAPRFHLAILNERKCGLDTTSLDRIFVVFEEHDVADLRPFAFPKAWQHHFGRARLK